MERSASSSSARATTENLKDTEAEDEKELAGVGGEDEDFDAMLEDRRISTIWTDGGKKKDEVIRKLIKLFGSFVVKYEDEESLCNQSGRREMTYEKLPDAHVAVVKARVLLRDNENYNSRDFTLFVSNKKWVKSELAPLLELSIDDRDLAMRCCKLALVLIKNLRDPAKKAIQNEVKGVKGKETKEEGIERSDKEMRIKRNALQQVSALLSFKEALCTEKCAIAISNVLAWALQKERDEQRDETKLDIATCYSYIRRLMQIDAVPNCSPPGEILMAKNTHNKLILHLRAMLLTIPTTCADIFARYNDDWLNDIILIVFFTLR